MALYQINLNVHSDMSHWVASPESRVGILSDSVVGDIPRYRLYLNHDLLTERSWIWGNTRYIQENVTLELDKNTQNTITIKPVKSRLGSAVKFIIKDCRWNSEHGYHAPVTMRLVDTSTLLLVT